MVKQIFPLGIVIFLAVVAGFPLLQKGLHPTHDGEYHIIRFYEFDRVLRDGNLYPRWAPDLNNGFGIPLFNYVYPIPNYVASIFHLFGVSFIDSFKLQLFLSLIISAVFFYLWSKQFWGELGGVVSSVLYTYSPYHFVDIYVRGSVGEAFSLAFFPIFLWSITCFIRDNQKKHFVISAVILALIIFSHNILAIMFFPFAVIYMLIISYQKGIKKEILVKIIYIILLSLGLSSIFWLPALAETKYVQGLQVYGVNNYFPELYQLLIPSWGTGFSESGSFNQMSSQIGIANLFAVFIGISVLVIKSKKNDQTSKLMLFFIISFFILFFIMLRISYPIWKTIPFMNYFQFPWRFLSLEILVTSFLAGSVVFLLKSKIVALILVMSAVILTISYTTPAYYHDRDDKYYVTRSNFIDGTNSPGNSFNTIWFNRNLPKKKSEIEGNFIVLKSETKTTYNKFDYISKTDSVALINTAYFPGWTAYIDGKIEKIDHNSEGLIMISILSGKHKLELRLEETKIQRFGSILTFASAIILVLMYGKFNYEKVS